jgi:glutathione S-transferase
MLDAKGVEYRRLDLFPAASQLWLRLLGYRKGTVPALRMGNSRVQGTRDIARALDTRWPDPPLFPSDPHERAEIEDLEKWADDQLQVQARRIVLTALSRSPAGVRAALEGSALPLPIPAALAVPAAAPLLWLDRRIHRVTDAAAEDALRRLPDSLDRLDAAIGRGDLGRRPPTAADFQVAASVRMLLTLDDLLALLANRPVTQLARQLIPHFTGRIPAGALPRHPSGPRDNAGALCGSTPLNAKSQPPGRMSPDS